MPETPAADAPPAPLFRIEVERGRAVTRVAVCGDIDLKTVDSIERMIRSARAESDTRHLVLDLRGLIFMDSTGLRLFMSLLRDARQNDYRLTLVRPPPHIHRAIEISGLSNVLRFVDEPAEAAVQSPD